jgi:hypothetical protein
MAVANTLAYTATITAVKSLIERPMDKLAHLDIKYYFFVSTITWAASHSHLSKHI